MKPTSVNIIGVEYQIEYVDKPSEVDIFKRDSLWGQIDYWTRTIRVYDNGRPAEDVWQTIFHEVLHGIQNALHIDKLKDDEPTIDVLATTLVDTLFRNGWMQP